jgi:DedD protein
MNDLNEKNELNDIILNKSGSTNSNKKIILAVATLGVILIVVVMLMNSLSSNGTENLPQAVLPPQPQTIANEEPEQEPLFEDIEVIEEASSSDNDLDMIAQKLKEESLQEEVTPPKKEIVRKEPKKVTPKKEPTPPKVVKKRAPASQAGIYYVQVGSFSKYAPNKKFLNSISALGYNYKYHKVKNLNKVLVGPFKTQKDAKRARHALRSKVEPGAFLVKL